MSRKMVRKILFEVLECVRKTERRECEYNCTECIHNVEDGELVKAMEQAIKYLGDSDD